MLILLLICMSKSVKSQFQIELYEDIGRYNSVASPFFKTAAMVSFQCDEYVVSIGNQWNVSKKDLISVPDLFINYTHKFVVFKQAIDVQAFLLYIPFTPPLYELDWGVLAAYSLQRFRFKLGTHFRMYRISVQLSKKILHHKRNIFEYFNMMYLVYYYINRPDNAGM